MATVNERGFIETDSGLIVPRGAVSRSVSKHIEHPFEGRAASKIGNGNGNQIVLRRDDQGMVYCPAYGTGLDDLAMREIVLGNVGNIGTGGVFDPDLSTIVAKRQSAASTWMISVTGKRLPVSKAVSVISAANDSHMGASSFVEDLIGAVDVDNRGAFFTQVPIDAVAFDQWLSVGMDAVPLLKEGETDDSKATHFVLQMGTPAFRANRGLWSLDGLACAPTGKPEYPFWYSTYSAERKKRVWVLIHKDFGGQIIQKSGPKYDKWAGYGQSAVWRYLSVFAQDVLLQDLDYEAMMNMPPRGVVHARGMDAPGQFQDQLTLHQKSLDDANIRLFPGVMFMETTNDKSAVVFLEWAKKPEDFSQEQWRRHKEDVLVSCFHMSIGQIRQRNGEGAQTQSRITNEIESETATAWMRTILERVFNHIAPPRVLVSVHWKSDRQRRFQVETFSELALGIERLQKAGGEEGVLTRDEMRAMVEDVGAMTLPKTEGREVTSDPRHTGADLQLATFGVEPNGAGDDLPELPADYIATPHRRRTVAWMDDATDEDISL